jgi:hypothetical protein
VDCELIKKKVLTRTKEFIVRIDEIVGRVDDWHDGRLANDGDVKSALFERQKTPIAVARTLGEKPQLVSQLFHFPAEKFNLSSRTVF